MDINKDFYIKQIVDTKKIIKRFSSNEEFSPTMLINSLLSLVVLPYEKAKVRDRSRVFQGKYKDLQNSVGVLPTIFQPISKCDNETPCYNRKSIYSFVNKFRNGIAHQNLEVSVDDKKRIRIKIYNQYSCNNCKKCDTQTCKEKGLTRVGNSVRDFEIIVTVLQLQRIALYIADSYLKAINK